MKDGLDVHVYGQLGDTPFPVTVVSSFCWVCGAKLKAEVTGAWSGFCGEVVAAPKLNEEVRAFAGDSVLSVAAPKLNEAVGVFEGDSAVPVAAPKLNEGAGALAGDSVVLDVEVKLNGEATDVLLMFCEGVAEPPKPKVGAVGAATESVEPKPLKGDDWAAGLSEAAGPAEAPKLKEVEGVGAAALKENEGFDA